MAEKLLFDDGLLRLDINGNGILSFNPSDPNVYHRFVNLVKSLPKIEERYKNREIEKGNSDLESAEIVLKDLHDIDKEVKAALSDVFGAQNDFDQLLGGSSLMAFGKNGERVVTNLLNALTPYMESGLKRHMDEKANEAVAEAKKRREQLNA